MAILDATGKPFVTRPPRGRAANLRAGYDAAETNVENSRHWSKADKLTADAWATPARRAIIRARMRYERQNNCYIDGMTETLVDGVVGTGPRLQLLSDSDNANQSVEERFAEWSELVGLAEKLGLAVAETAAGGGESFLMFFENDGLRRTDERGRELPTVALDLRQYEADQIDTPDKQFFSDDEVSGIRFDANGNPREYHVLKQHPGGLGSAMLLDYDKVPASDMIHFFKAKRPGQRRGIAEMAPALPLGSQLRRLTLATLMSAELQASITGTIESSAPADTESDDAGLIAGENLEMERGMWPVLPDGYKANAFPSTQPTDQYKPFKREIIGESARCIKMPLSIAIANSEGLNYSSGRLDHQMYFKSLVSRRRHIERVILERVFLRWFELAVLVEGYLPQPARMRGFRIKHKWMWDGFEHVDPTKEATADQIDLATGRKTFADLCAADGTDWIEQKKQRARELAMDRELGIPSAGVPAPAQSSNDNADTQDENN